MVERQARNPEVRGSNPGSGSNFSLEILQYLLLYILLFVSCELIGYLVYFNSLSVEIEDPSLE